MGTMLRRGAWGLWILAGAGGMLSACSPDSTAGGASPPAGTTAGEATGAAGEDAGGQPVAIPWVRDRAVALREARAADRPILVDFYATWCGPCKLMDRTTFQDPGVLERIHSFVPLKVDVDREPELAREFEIESIPTTVVLSADGEVLARAVGYLAAEDFLQVLDRALPPAPEEPRPKQAGPRKKEEGREVRKGDFHTVDPVVRAVDGATGARD